MRSLIAVRSKISLLILLTYFLIFPPSIWSQAKSSSQPQTIFPFHKRESVKPDQLSDGNKYKLESWPVIQGSAVVYVDGTQKLKDIDYEVDYQLGEVRFLKTLDPKSEVIIEYDFIPIPLKRSYQRQLFAPKEPPKPPVESEERAAQKPLPPLIPPAELNVSGSQTFSLSLGSNREFPPPLTQALHLNIEGKVTEKVSISALLSDQNLPIQPEGTTEEIQDLDQVLIKVTSPNFSAALGEYEANLGAGEFVFFPRNLQGAQADINFQRANAGLLGAVAKGQSGSITIQGIEGRNEYRADVKGEFVIMVAGSETVWLNGERMKRGETNDYVIRDYGDPIIEFTNKHLITQNDVIRVDFEYISEAQSFVQDIYGAHSNLNILSGKGSFGIAYAAESDDKSKQIFPLSEMDIQRLRENKIGEESQKIGLLAPQSHSVIGLNGNLNLGESANIIGEVALSKRDLNTFSNLDKVQEGRAWKLAMTSKSRKFRMDLDFRNLDPHFLPVGSTVASRTRYRYEDRYKNSQFDDILSAEPQIATGERELDLDMEYQPVNSVKLQGNLGRRSEKSSEAKASDITDHWSRTISFALADLPKLDHTYQESKTSSEIPDESKRSRDIWHFKHTVGKLNFSAQNEEVETFNPAARGLTSFTTKFGRKRSVKTFRLGSDQFKSLSLSIEGGLEENFEKESTFEVDMRPLTYSDWIKSSAAINRSLLLSATPLDWLNLSGNLSNRQLRNLRQDRSESSVNLADFRLNLLPFKRALQTDLNYQIDRKLDSIKEETYLKVPKGQGQYRKVDELHYEEDLVNGEYVRFVETVGDRPVSALDFQFRIRFQPGRLITSDAKGTSSGVEKRRRHLAKTLANAVSLELKWTIDEEQEGEGSKDLYLLRRLQTEETVFGRKDFIYRISFSPGKKLDANFDYRNGSSINKRFNDRLRNRDSESFELDLKSAITSKISTNLEWSKSFSKEQIFNLTPLRKEELQIGRNPPSELTSDITQFERKGAFRFRYDLNQLVRLGLGFERNLERDSESFRSTALLKTSALTWNLGYSILEKGRLDVSYKFASGKRKGELPFTRFDFYEGLSHELTKRFEYRFKGFTDITIRSNYNLILSQVQKPDHRLEMEVSAEF